MGREIRMVPKGWEHPRNEKGELRPCYDQTYIDAVREWKDGYSKWENKTHEDYDPELEFWEYDSPPDKEYYRPAFDGPADHFQIYETVSDGTPTSPIFATKNDMITWLVSQGYSQKASEAFAKCGSAPSMTFSRGEGVRMNIHSLG